MENKMQEQFKIMYETHKLLSACVEALAKTTVPQDDEMVLKLLDSANMRLWESRYWLGEAMNFFEAKTKQEGNNVKGN